MLIHHVFVVFFLTSLQDLKDEIAKKEDDIEEFDMEERVRYNSANPFLFPNVLVLDVFTNGLDQSYNLERSQI